MAILFRWTKFEIQKQNMSGKWVAYYQNWGGDVNENRHFVEGKLVAHYQNFEYHKWAIFFRWTTFEIQKQNMSLLIS